MDDPGVAFRSQAWQWRLNVTEWWCSLLPLGAPHRTLLLDAASRLAEFLRQVADMAKYMLAHMMSGPDEEPCDELFQLLLGAALNFESLGKWATGLRVEDEIGMLQIANGVGRGPRGVVQRWVSEVGRLFYSQPWQMEVSCFDVHGKRRALNWQRLWIMVYTVLVGAGRLQSTWPWLVDSAAVAAAAGVAITAPAETEACLSDAEVLRTLLGQLARAEPLVVEVGVDLGQTSAALLEALPALRLVGVDPYLDRYGGVPSSQRSDGMAASSRYPRTAARYAQFGGRAELRRVRSLEAAQNWTGGAIDLVFIDAEHDFVSCRDDIAAWARHVQSGIVAGDDYRWGVPGVWRAVHELLPPGAELHVAPGGVWWWLQPPRGPDSRQEPEAKLQTRARRLGVAGRRLEDGFICATMERG